MEELFEELVYKHLKEYHPKAKFCTSSGEVAGNKYIWINHKKDWQTYIYLTKFRGQYWYAVITTDALKGKDILMNELSILGFMVFDL